MRIGIEPKSARKLLVEPLSKNKSKVLVIQLLPHRLSIVVQVNKFLKNHVSLVKMLAKQP